MGAAATGTAAAGSSITDAGRVVASACAAAPMDDGAGGGAVSVFTITAGGGGNGLAIGLTTSATGLVVMLDSVRSAIVGMEFAGSAGSTRGDGSLLRKYAGACAALVSRAGGGASIGIGGFGAAPTGADAAGATRRNGAASSPSQTSRQIMFAPLASDSQTTFGFSSATHMLLASKLVETKRTMATLRLTTLSAGRRSRG